MKVGVIAGNGQFPLLFSRAAKEKGYGVYAAAIKNEASPDLEGLCEQIEWFHLGQVKKLIRFFRSHGVTEVVLVGGIKKTNIFKDIRPDTKAVAFLARMRHTHDDTLLSAFSRLLETEGLQVRSSTFLVPEILADGGLWTRKKPSTAQIKDIRTGWDIAKEIGRLDVGQCIVMGGGSVLAVEAIDGTDATIRRGGSLGTGDAVLIKVSKPTQDMRFDVPAVGLQTLQTMKDAGVTGLVLEAGHAVVFDRDAMVAYANDNGMTILVVDGSPARCSVLS
ncbi:UDP-2,3-diacylglucosamine diphosphatase LpxI [Desulfoluna sp.]|uniref:LpxI family protein n=1 Tax=Desulfoluna sp. TaxID=2045199 RepID=UPI00262A0E8A|nr:UDP-2,3-diacylglucosamine diphosphatase LpxI [Desulfoluna sp.]